jgi:hypothetical protein
MHQLGVYYILRARGYSPGDADRMAGFSQYVDQDLSTEPLRANPWTQLAVGVNNAAIQTRVFFHFIGSTETTPTVRNDIRARERVAQTFAMLTSGRKRERAAGLILAGVAMHTFLDTYAHEGFTGYPSSKINTRADTWPLARVGHVDTGELGHAPDRPYNNVDKAIEALHALYDLVPESGQDKRIPWYKLEPELRIALSAHQPELADRMATMQKLIQTRFGDTMNLDMQRFANEGPMFRRYTEDWRERTERTEATRPEATTPSIPVAPLR